MTFTDDPFHASSEFKDLQELTKLGQQLREQRRNLKDLHGEKGEVEVVQRDAEPSRPYPGTPADRYGLEVADLSVEFTQFSWGQLSKKLDLPRAFAERLHKENRPLLVQNMQHCFDQQDGYLLRLQHVVRAGERIWQLRALLNPNYNRLDNIYLIDPVLALCQNTDLRLRRFHFDGDTLTIQLLLQEKQKLLKRVGDEVLTGISITNSDIGQVQALTVEAYYERLVCTNGMTVSKSRKVVAPKSLNDTLGTRYWNTLPPAELEDDLRKELRDFFGSAWKELAGDLAGDVERLRGQMRQLAEIPIDFADERAVKTHIEAMLLHSGLRVHPGISVQGIYEAYKEEREDFPASANSALILYNATTRYASNQLTSDDPSANTRRTGRGRPIPASRAENLQLSRTLIGTSWRLLPSHLKWEKVLETARRDKTVRMRLPEV